eukprot:TRINITY_DN3535_c0_g1_i5.p1 TRINITY_DN3535_c0_g1~~TRINITY_DN3535_c0_g1_i5.p1  ORF type:complete len:340 (-),score=66.61 TRINITY_DN3535_c0_g1_i5:74-1093(-)
MMSSIMNVARAALQGQNYPPKLPESIPQPMRDARRAQEMEAARAAMEADRAEKAEAEAAMEADRAEKAEAEAAMEADRAEKAEAEAAMEAARAAKAEDEAAEARAEIRRLEALLALSCQVRTGSGEEAESQGPDSSSTGLVMDTPVEAITPPSSAGPPAPQPSISDRAKSARKRRRRKKKPTNAQVPGETPDQQATATTSQATQPTVQGPLAKPKPKPKPAAHRPITLEDLRLRNRINSELLPRTLNLWKECFPALFQQLSAMPVNRLSLLHSLSFTDPYTLEAKVQELVSINEGIRFSKAYVTSPDGPSRLSSLLGAFLSYRHEADAAFANAKKNKNM